MEEKKLTNDTDTNVGMFDEAVIDTLKEMAIKHSNDSYVYRVFVNTIRLINRLQDENKRLEDNNRVLMAMNKGLKMQHNAETEQAVKKVGEQIKMAFFYEFDELIPSIMADKIDEICKNACKGG